MCRSASWAFCGVCVFFFCKQKTAYEMRISDWSSDVCSSDLFGLALARIAFGADIDIVEVGGDEVVVAVDRVIRNVDRFLFAAQQHFAPKFVARFLEGRIEADDRDFGVFARLPLDRRRGAEPLAVLADEAIARDARLKGFGHPHTGDLWTRDEYGAP